MDINIDGKDFRIIKLPVRTQFNVARRLTPILSSFVPVVKTVMTDVGEELEKQEPQDFKKMALSLFDKNQDAIFDAVNKFTDIFSTLPDEQVDYILDQCLSVCKWKNGNAFIDVSLNPDQFDLGVQLQLVFLVIKDSLGGFIPGLVMKAESLPSQP